MLFFYNLVLLPKIKQSLYHLINSFFYIKVIGVQSTCFNVQAFLSLGKFLQFSKFNLAFLLQIALISNNENLTVFRSLFLNAVYPKLNSIKRPSIGNIINNNRSLGIAVKSLSNCIKPFLSCSIPELQLYCLVLNNYVC